MRVLVVVHAMPEIDDEEARELQSSICHSDVTFQKREMSELATNDFMVFAIDLDSDGDVDVLSASASNDVIQWYDNQGDSPPTFEKRDISEQDNPRMVFAIDLDNDGDADVLSASKDDNTISWYENDGGSPPGFHQRVITRTAVEAEAVFAIDLDGDGDVDVLSASYGDDTIAWYESDGELQPNFQKRVITSTASGAIGVFAIDLDGDSDIDVLSAAFLDHTIAWYENDGGYPPTFEQRELSSLAFGAVSVFAIDLDADGDVDVLSASSLDDTVAWYENDGNRPPEFQEKVLTSTAERAYSVFAIDLDGDGDVDVLSASYLDDKLAWYENNGGSPATFAEKSVVNTVGGASSVFAIDMDNDGDIDVLSGSAYFNNAMWYESSCISEESKQPTPQPATSEISSGPTDSSSSNSRSIPEDLWEFVGALIGIMSILIPVTLWWLDKGQDFPQRRCCPRLHFYFFDCCVFEDADFETYRERYHPSATAITGPLQQIQGLFGVIDSDSDGRVSQGRFLNALREFPELADFFKLPRNIEQEGSSRIAFTNVFDFLVDNNGRDFDEVRWRTRCAQFEKEFH